MSEPESKADIPAAKSSAAAEQKSHRVAALDWMRGLVMVLMVIDHASMAFNGHRLAEDSAFFPGAGTMTLPAAEFLVRWLSHLCAPAFVFLAGTALALSVERRVAKGVYGWEIDKTILFRGAVIALLDPTVISLGSGRWTFQVLLAIGLSMMCMALLRRLPSWLLVGLALGWLALGELLTLRVWHPPGSASPLAAFTLATYGAENMVIKYPLLPWLAMMMLGWVFGRHMNRFAEGKSRISPKTMMVVAGVFGLVVFAVVRGLNGYGQMSLYRADNSWQQWLHVSKYPPSLSFSALELGLLCLSLALLMAIEPVIGVRANGVLLVFGQTAMFFYIVHRLAFEVPATYFGLRGVGNLVTAFLVSIGLLLVIYPVCLWFRRLKAAHPASFLKYF